MTQTKALRLALEALKEDRAWLETDAPTEVWEKNNEAITTIKAALEAKDEKANDELRRLHDLLGKANALARIRANKIDELEQRLTKTEAQLGEAVWNYGELKREQLANQQKTSGSPINTSTALEAKDEPVATIDSLEQEIYENTRQFVSLDVMEWMLKRYYTTPPQRKPLTLEQLREHWKVAKVLDMTDAEIDFADYVLIARDVEALHGIKGEA